MKQQKYPLSLLYIIGGTISLYASFIIMIEKLALYTDPAYVASCDINPLISCGAIMASPEASVFGFPNPLLGIASFAVVIALGVAIRAGAKFDRWYWRLIQLGMTFAIGFVYWLFYVAVFEIGALCLYCMVVWVLTIPLFLYTTVYNLRERNLFSALPRKVPGWLTVLTLVIMNLVIFLSIAYRFWDRWLIMLG